MIGAGYAGISAALFLQRAGHAVTLYEAVDIPAPVGAGILLQPTGLEVLQRLGLKENTMRYGTRVDRLFCRTAKGRPVFSLKYADHDDRLFGIGLHRGVLFQVLFGAIRETSCTVKLGTRIVQKLEGGRLRDERGNVHGPHDLLVIADGARSSLRKANFPVALDKPYPWGALWFVARDPGHLFAKELSQVVCGSRQMLGFLPTGRAPQSETNLTSIFWSLRTRDAASWRRQMRLYGLHEFKKTILDFEPRSASLLTQIEHVDQILFATYRDVRLRKWINLNHDVPCVILGDAAHAMSPQLGQGSNLAFVDAITLADALEEHSTLFSALTVYQKARCAHLSYYQRANRLITPFFQSDALVYGLGRDLFFPWASRIPTLHSMMVETLCGNRRGFFQKRAVSTPTYLG